MDAQELRNLQEAYMEVVMNEGLGGAKNQGDYEERENERQRDRDEHLRKYKSGELSFQKQKKADQAQEFLKKHPRKKGTQQEQVDTYDLMDTNLLEEVQISAQYFYEMGLNEYGVDILIEDLGLEKFVELVYDIAEEYVLTEARAGGAKIEPKLASGKPIQGKPKAASLKRLRAQKAERTKAETKASASKPSGMKASLQRQSAVAAAAKKQPKKPGILDRVAGAVNRGIERHNAAMAAAKETGKTIRKAAGKVGGVAKEVGKGASGAAKLAGHVASKGLKEGYDSRMGRGEMGEPKRTVHQKVDKEKFAKDMKLWADRNRKVTSQIKLKNKGNTYVPKKDGKDMFEHILGHLIDNGYADSNQTAIAIIENMSEEWKQSILEEKKTNSKCCS